MTNFNEQTNTLLYKNMYLSHFILERVDVSIVCGRWVETGTDCYIDPTSSLDHSSTSSASWLGCPTGGHWGPQLSVCKVALTLAFLSPTNSTAAGTCLNSFIRLLASASLHRCISHWRLGQRSIYNICLRANTENDWTQQPTSLLFFLFICCKLHKETLWFGLVYFSTVYKPLKVCLIPKFDQFLFVSIGLIYLFNGISTLYWLLNAEI